MFNQPAMQEIQISIEGAKKLKSLAEALERLEKNKDFKTVIGTAYMEDEVFRLTGMLSEVTDDRNAPAALGGISKASIVQQLTSIANLSAFLREVRRKTDGIGATLLAYEQEQELQRQEAEGAV